MGGDHCHNYPTHIFGYLGGILWREGGCAMLRNTCARFGAEPPREKL